MTIQWQALGLSARQFRAFDQAALHAEFSIPNHWQLATITAFGPPASGRKGPRGEPAAAGPLGHSAARAPAAERPASAARVIARVAAAA